jgi:hypothetical protein
MPDPEVISKNSKPKMRVSNFKKWGETFYFKEFYRS